METHPKRCDKCWALGPPKYWERSSAPIIPGTKHELLIALKRVVPDQPCSLESLTKEELKALFRAHVRGERHRGDPTVGMSSLKKAQLLDLLSDHGETLPMTSTKGALMSGIRQHWLHQCYLANSVDVGGSSQPSDSQDAWEVVTPSSKNLGSEKQEGQIRSVNEALDTMMKATSAFYDMLDEECPSLRSSVCKSAEARDKFVLSVELLIAKSQLN